MGFEALHRAGPRVDCPSSSSLGLSLGRSSTGSFSRICFLQDRISESFGLEVSPRCHVSFPFEQLMFLFAASDSQHIGN